MATTKTSKTEVVTEPKKSVKQKLAKKKAAKANVKVDTKKVDEKNLKNTVTTIVKSKREVKYIYPDSLEDDQIGRKKHRAEVRNKDKKFLAEIADLERTKKPTDKVVKAYAKFRKENYLVA